MTRTTFRAVTLVAEDGRRTEGDEIWRRLRSEAGAVMTTEPALGGLVLTSILDRVDFADAVLHRLAMRLARDALSMDLLLDAFRAALASDPEIEDGFRADIVAVVDRDPACERLIEPFLFFKGWSAIQTHRLAHRLWLDGRLDLALTLQSRSSETFQTDIHPAAVFGTGIFLDHATGLVVGETAVLEDEISLLQDVTLGGTGKATGDRHPKILHGSLIGAGAKILGAITVGPGARVAAGSVVLKPVAPHTTVAGIPARVVGGAGSDDPSKTMDQNLPDGGYASFTYMI